MTMQEENPAVPVPEPSAPLTDAPLYVAPVVTTSTAPETPSSNVSQVEPSEDESMFGTSTVEPAATAPAEVPPEASPVDVQPAAAEPVLTTADVGLTPPEGDALSENAYPTSDTVLEATNVHLTEEVMIKRKKNGPIAPYEVLSLPEVPTDQDIDIRENNPLASSDEETEARKRWEAIILASDNFRPMAGQYESTLNRPNSDFHQGINTENGPMGLSVPAFRDQENLSGEAALMRVRTMMGQGSLVAIPLPHSGFWITIRTPANGDIIELRRRLMEERIELGRQSHGLVLSNSAAYTNRYLLDMVLDHLYSTTLKDGDPASVRKLIKAPDLPILQWGLACAIYPTGFEYVKAVMSKEGIAESQYETGLINIKKLYWADNGALTESQRRHMASRQKGQMTTQRVEDYQNSMRMAEGRTFDVKTVDSQNDGQIKIKLKIPTVNEYVESGEQWIMGLNDIIERTLTSDRTDEHRRNSAILDHARATKLRQYGHWIAGVEVHGKFYDDKEWLAKFLNSMSEDEAATRSIHEEIHKYIDDCTVAVIAIPSSNGNKVGPPRFPRLIPIDALSAFFTLFMQRASRLVQ